MLFFPFLSHATVGGNTVLSDFGYLPKENALYFLSHNYSGRGCPSELKKFNLATEQIETIISCDEQMDSEKDFTNDKKEILEKTEPLSLIDLPSLNLQTEYSLLEKSLLDDKGNFVSLKLDEQTLQAPKLFWEASLKQKDSGKTIQFSTCFSPSSIPSLAIRGLAIPNNKGIILLFISENICFEQGYLSAKPFYFPSFSYLEKNLDEIPSDFNSHLPFQHSVEKFPKGLFFKLPLSQALNNFGFAAYQKEQFDIAKEYFQKAYQLSKNGNPHLLSLFNLAATLSKTGEEKTALEKIEELLNYQKEKQHYQQKILSDPDFSSLADNPEFIELVGTPLPNNTTTVTITASPSSNNASATPTATEEPKGEKTKTTPEDESTNKFNVWLTMLNFILLGFSFYLLYRSTKTAREKQQKN